MLSIAMTAQPTRDVWQVQLVHGSARAAAVAGIVTGTCRGCGDEHMNRAVVAIQPGASRRAEVFCWPHASLGPSLSKWSDARWINPD